MIKHYIIAGNHNEFINWKKKPEIQAIAFLEDTVHQFVYVSSVDSLRGIHEPHGKLIGTWYNRPDLNDILHQLLIAGSFTIDQYDNILVQRNLILKLSPDLSMYANL
jgi:hypothetical protein